ncbi:hypothetical protein RJ639_033952 [Escallonia herrerae]|uniref:Bet v I/Major latex protein domain-containing protein n=1 Tax=Escallonia herrerae TaxID=1293975 RepID=A0AA88WWI5_9ASTE|nr:hypothetical protein RJ639_033952 [Escallonia herrerae]
MKRTHSIIIVKRLRGTQSLEVRGLAFESVKFFGSSSTVGLHDVPAQEAWQIYGTLQITHVTHTFDKIEVLQGDGGVGTTLKLTLPAVLHLTMKFLTSYVLIETGTTVFSSYEEMYTKVDDEKMINEAEVISGGYLDLRFTLYRTRFEIIETSKTSCITKTTIEYDVNEEDVSILPMISMMKDFATYLLENTKN